jgi:hypothetical protein
VLVSSEGPGRGAGRDRVHGQFGLAARAAGKEMKWKGEKSAKKGHRS